MSKNSDSAWKKGRHFLFSAVLCGLSVIMLQACLPVMVGGTVTGTMAATDRRTVGAQAEDKAINFKGSSRASTVVGDKGNVNVTSFNRMVLLTGEVKDQAMRDKVEYEVSQIDGVQSIINELAIAAPSSFASRSSDAWITGKVSASFLDAKDLFANSLKTVTERGTVYLMGRVTEREGASAAQVAGGVSGVQRVVKVFEYITEDELRRLSMQSAPSESTNTQK